MNWLQSLFGNLIVVEQVAEEYGSPLPEWIEIKNITEKHVLSSFLKENLGKGEAASLTLALELDSPLLILDDQKARKKARSLNLTITGTSGILLLAKKRGLCDAIKPELNALLKAGMWLAPSLYNRLLSLADEEA
ncbi:MAG: DUF3368 domain-containing protein [Bacteroidia bacterium]